MENQPVMIKDIRQGMKNLVMTVIVLDVGPPVQVKEREVRTLKVADGTACINLSLWGEAGNHVCPGDIIRMSKAHVNVYRNCVTLLNGKSCEIDKIGEFCMVFNEQINMSEPNLELGAGAQGAVVGKNGAPPHGMIPVAAQSGGVGPQNPSAKPMPLGGPPPRLLPPQQLVNEPPMNKGPNKMNCGGNGNKSLPPPRGGGPGGGMKSNLPRPDRR